MFRINRYGFEGRRSDPVTLDEKLVFAGDEYILEAILQHEGERANSGHYIIFLRLNGVWECRNDARQDVYDGMPQYSPENVYVVVYSLLQSSTSSSSSRRREEGEQAAKREREGQAPAVPKTSESANKVDAYADLLRGVDTTLNRHRSNSSTCCAKKFRRQ